MRWALVLLSAALLAGCGGDDGETAPEPVGEDGGASDPVLKAVEFCSTAAGAKLEILGEKANEADFSAGEMKNPAKAQAAIEEIMRISEDAPPGATCAYNALDRAADAYRLGYLPNASEGIREVARFQRTHNLTQADVLGQ